MTRFSSQNSYLSYALASDRQNLIVYPRTLAKRRYLIWTSDGVCVELPNDYAGSVVI